MDKSMKVLFFLLLLTSCVMPNASPESGSNVTSTPYNPLTQTPSQIANTVPVMIPSETALSLRPTPFAVIEFYLQPGTPSAIPNFAHPESGCNWMGVGGQIFDYEGKPMVKLLVRLTGNLEGKNINYVALTGGAINLGSGGYEFKLADQPLDTKGGFQITILDERGEPISQPFSFDTYNDCNKNFTLINFTQVIRIQNGFKLFLPVTMVDGG